MAAAQRALFTQRALRMYRASRRYIDSFPKDSQEYYREYLRENFREHRNEPDLQRIEQILERSKEHIAWLLNKYDIPDRYNVTIPDPEAEERIQMMSHIQAFHPDEIIEEE